MLATRARLSFAGELLTTTVSLGPLLLVGLLAARELRNAPAAFALASTPASSVAASVPPDAVSVPALVLNEGNAISVGDRLADTLARLHGSVTLLRRIEERGPLGVRDVSAYQHAGTDFILVVEPFERGGEPRVAAIYVK